MSLTLHMLASIGISTGLLLGTLGIRIVTLCNLTVYKVLTIFSAVLLILRKKKKGRKQQANEQKPMNCFLSYFMQRPNKKVDCLFYDFHKLQWMVYCENKCLCCVCVTVVCSLMNVLSAWLLEFYFHKCINTCFARVWDIELTGCGISYSLNNLLDSPNPCVIQNSCRIFHITPA